MLFIPTAYDKKTLLGFPIDEDRKKTAQKAQQQRENNQRLQVSRKR